MKAMYFLLLKRAAKFIMLIGAILYCANIAHAQVSVTATAGTTGPTAYTTLKAAFDAVNAGTHQGNITISITATTTETATASLNASGSGSASYTSVVVKPASATTPTVSGSISSGPIVKLNGARNVTIDGSNNGSTSRDLNITNTSTSSSNVLQIGSVGATPITNVTVKNCIMTNGTNTSTAVLVGDAATVGAPGYFSNITIQNNSIQKAYIGLYTYATVAAGNGNNTLITGNDMNSSGTNALRLVGVYVQGATGVTVSNNNIGNFEGASAEFDRAIWLATATTNTTVSGNTISGLSYTGTSSYAPIGLNISSGVTSANISITGNTVDNLTSSGTGTTMGIFSYSAMSGVTYTKNKVINIKNTNTSGYGAAGILMAHTINTASTTISNNFVSDVAAYGFNDYTSNDNGNGIVIDGGGGYNIYDNTVVLNSNQTITGAHRASCLLITANVTASATLNVRNNIFANLQTVGNANSRLCISNLATAGSAVFSAIDYNNYYATSVNLSSTGTNASITNTLAQLQTSLGGNTHSVNVQPVFISASDLHLDIYSNTAWDNMGVPIGGITDDIDGETRNATTPDIGADEINFICPAVTTLYVDGSVGASGDGSSWATAFKKLSDAVTTARLCSGIENILVAQGTYYPTGTQNGTDRNATFAITRGGLKIYGGYPSGGGTRDAAANPTILSGNIAAAGTVTDNSRHVMVITGLTAGADSVVIDGFTVKDGYADGGGNYTVNAQSIANDNGSGLVTQANNNNDKIAIRNCTFNNGYAVGAGGAVENTTNSMPAFSDCIFTNNYAGLRGGAVRNIASSAATYTNSTFTDNASGDRGGAIENDGSSGLYNDCMFENDSANNLGGAMFNTTSSITANNCIFTGNKTNAANNSTGTGYGGGIYNNNSYLSASSCRFINNQTTSAGGGVVVANGNLSNIASCVFYNNSAVSADGNLGTGGGAQVNSSGGTLNIINTIFANNTAGGINDDGGGGIMGYGGTITCNNVSFSNNATGSVTKPNANAISTMAAATATLNNSIVWGDSAQQIHNLGTLNYNYSLIKGYTVTSPNLSTDPLYIDPTDPDGADNVFGNADDGLQLQGCSPAIDAGDNAAIPGSITTDLTGVGRIFNTTVDMGAYEAQDIINVAQPLPVVGCNGLTIASIVFPSGSTSLMGLPITYTWSHTNTAMGQSAANGTGNIPSYTAINNNNAPLVDTFTVIGATSNNFCIRKFTVTVNPTPDVTATSDQILCNGAATTAITFTSGVSGTTYSWVNNKTSIGLGASGNGNISSFTAINTGTTLDTAIVIVTPTAATCPGTPDTFRIIVKPTPTVNTVSNQSICNGAPTTAINFGGTVAGTTYAWTNNTTSIGLGASGNGNIASFTATNTTTANVTGTITVTPTAAGCPGTAITPTITVKPTPIVNTVANQSICNGAPTAAITFSSPVAGTTYAWTNNRTSIGLAASGTGDIASFTATNTTTANVTGTITVTPTAASCPGTAITPTITVKPTPTVNTVANQSVCNGAPTTDITFGGPVTGTTFAWTNNNTSIGLAASGNGNIASFTATNTTSANVTGTITVTPTAAGCPGTAKTPTITVKPTPVVNAVSNQSVCNNSPTSVINFTSATAGTTYAWTNNTTSIGLAASGNGNIASFTATNATSANITGTITVTPTAAGCPGIAITPTITVKPTPDVATVSNQAVCNGASTTAINFSGAVTGSTFSWTNNTTSIGLAASGNGNIVSFAAINTGTTPVTATITVTPNAASCPGPAKTFTITVNPTPTVNAVTNQIVCNNTATAAVNFSGAVTGSTYSWSNNTASIGLAASGSGNIPSFTANNTTSSPVTATITVTPTANTCPGPSKPFTILVNPTPIVNTIPDMVFCNTAASGDIIFSSATSGTTYTWDNSNPSIGLGASGNGNIFSFNGVNTGSAPATATITVTPTANGCPGPSKSFVITVNPTIVPTINISSSAPLNTICIHTKVTFTAVVTNEGTNPTFQWRKNGTLVGTNSLVYDDNNLADGDVITCELMSSIPCPSSTVVASSAIVTHVNMYVYHTIEIFSDKQGDTLCAGEVVNFTSDIKNGGSAPVYQWMKNGLNVGTNNPSYTDLHIADGDKVTCSLTTNILCPASSTITNSNRVVMHSLAIVRASVIIVGVFDGYSYVFHSQTTNCGDYPSYQWYLNGNPIAGATKDDLSIASLRETDKISLEVIPGRRCTNNAIANSNILLASQVTGVENIALIDRLTLAPNPNNGNFSVEGEINGLLQLKDADLIITNAVGQVMYRSKVDVHSGSIKAELQMKSVLVSGTYHLSIMANGQKYNARFVVIGE